MMGDRIPAKQERPTLDHPLLEKAVNVSEPPRGHYPECNNDSQESQDMEDNDDALDHGQLSE